MITKDITNALPAIIAKGLEVATLLGLIPFNPDEL